VYTVTFSRHAARSLRRIEGKQREVIRGRIDILARDPRDPRLDVRKLAGREGYRLRVGDWRVLYDIDDAVRVIAIEDVAQRGKAYR
jgi:mRNA interferase RelE/StbE